MSALVRGITLNHNEDFYCLYCIRTFKTKNKLKKHERVCHDHYYCYVEMPNEDNKILKHNHGEKSVKPPFIIYVELECLFEKMHSYQNNPEKSYTQEKTKHTTSGCSMFTNCSLDSTKNQFDCYRGKDCMESFCKSLKEHATKLINYEKKR